MAKKTLKTRLQWLKKKWLWGVGIVAVIVIAAMMASGGETLVVTEANAEMGVVQQLVEETATVSSRVERQVYSAGAGEILKANKKPGDIVSKGDLLVELDVRDVQLSIKEMKAQKAALEASYRDAQNPSKESVSQAKSKTESDKLAVEAAKRTYEQDKLLYEAGVGTLENVRQSEEAVKLAEKALQISESQYSEVKKGLTTEQKAKYQAEIEVMQTQIEQLQLNRERLQILSPLDGVVTLKEAEQGQQVLPGTLLYEIVDPDNIRLETDVLASDAGKIKVGTSIRAFDEEAGIEIFGTVERVYPKAFSKQSELGIEQKRIHMELKPQLVPENLLMGMELDLELIEEKKDSVLRVPDSAIFKIDNVPHVSVIEDAKAKLTQIEIGLEGKKYTEVKTGLKEGQRVVDAPGNDMKDGVKVTIEKIQ